MFILAKSSLIKALTMANANKMLLFRAVDVDWWDQQGEDRSSGLRSCVWSGLLQRPSMSGVTTLSKQPLFIHLHSHLFLASEIKKHSPRAKDLWHCAPPSTI